MRPLLVRLAGFAFSSLTFTHAAADCTPGPQEVAMFQHSDFGGRCVVKGIGVYPNSDDLSPVGNDSVSSIRVGSQVQALLCQHANFAGTCTLFLDDDANLGNNSILHDRTSSLTVQQKGCPPSDNQITLYQDVDYQGRCVALKIGTYDHAGEVGLPNDTVSSIKVGADAWAFLFRDVRQGGACCPFKTDTPRLDSTFLGNDEVSSVRVVAKGSTVTLYEPPKPISLEAPWDTNLSRFPETYQDHSGAGAGCFGEWAAVDFYTHIDPDDSEGDWTVRAAHDGTAYFEQRGESCNKPPRVARLVILTNDANTIKTYYSHVLFNDTPGTTRRVSAGAPIATVRNSDQLDGCENNPHLMFRVEANVGSATNPDWRKVDIKHVALDGQLLFEELLPLPRGPRWYGKPIKSN